MTSNKINI